MFKVFLEKKVEKKLKEIENKSRKLVLKRLKILEKGFARELDIKKLKGFKNHYRLRVGKFRILFYLAGDKIIIYRIAPREVVYER
jgi:mRNA interferase RelE/StbE